MLILVSRQEFALAGYEFCISTLEEKIEREKELAEDIMSGRKIDLSRCWVFSTMVSIAECSLIERACVAGGKIIHSGK